MSKKNKTKQLNEVPEAVNYSEKTNNNTNEISFGWNVGLLVFALIIMVVVYNNNDSYKWLYKQMLKGNLEFIKENPQLTYNDKIESKFGLDYSVLKTIVEKTPENAVVLFPSSKIIDTVRKVNKLPNRNENLMSKDWDEYFIFPRRIIFEEQKSISKIKPTHALILGGMGYENLTYPIENDKRKFLDVLPINK